MFETPQNQKTVTTEMFKITSYADLKVAYSILAVVRSKSQDAAELKREIRKFCHRPVSERRIIQDNGSDGYIELLPMLQYLETMDEAVNYFENYEYRRSRCHLYGCTDQVITVWYKVFIRDGRFWAHHYVGMDA